MIVFSPGKLCFFDTFINENIPFDAVSVLLDVRNKFCGQATVGKQIGADADGMPIWIDEDWLQQLDLVQQAKNAQVNTWRDNEEAKQDQRVTVDSVEWDANPASRKRIESTLQSSFTPPFWTDANDNDRPITQEKLQAIHTAIVQLGFAIHARQREMKAEVTALTTVETVNEYVIGWPQ